MSSPSKLPSFLLAWVTAAACHSAAPASAPPPAGGDAFGAHLADTRALEGLLELHIDDAAGRVWLVLPDPGADPVGDGGPDEIGGGGAGPQKPGVAMRLLYAEGLTTGLGSNPVGLDRGQLGPARVVCLRVVGERLLVEVENLGFRADTADPDERRATRESFASSILWAGEVVARDDTGAALVDFTSFLVRDAHGVRQTLARTGQGSWALDPERSTFDPAACLGFPDNVELEAILTFRGDDPGRHVRATVPDPHAITLVQHHSFIRLPDPGYRPRVHDPRSGANAVSYLDYAAPLGEPVERALAVRHRLVRTEPGDESSPVEEPIVYYIDRGTPEPVRSALFEGARWWASAFAAAGFPDAYRVELLPPGVHPLDARYNVIEWVHRSTRGWSYGGGVVDPRTGEMVKAHVSLGSLRVRQDQRLFEGLLGTSSTGTGTPEDPIELALARIRQLSAHEVGHTLGLAHNFAASTYGGRASVMDYPAPLVILDGDRLEVGDAYGVGVGSWDRFTIRCLYGESLPGEDERTYLDRMARESLAAGHLFLSDADARPAGAADPRASLWDNGPDAVRELQRVLEVRRVAIAGFGPDHLTSGRPRAELQEVFVPLYFHHRYQLDAALKTIGGFEYLHALAGDGRDPLVPISAAAQRAALDVILSVLEPARLDVPEELLRSLPPRSPDSSRNREMFESGTEPGIDALGIARAAARQVYAGLLQPERLNRLIDFERRADDSLSLDELVEALVVLAFDGRALDPRLAAIRDVVRHTLIDEWMQALMDPRLSSQTQARLEALLAARVEPLLARDAADVRVGARIERFLDRPWFEPSHPTRAPELPPGSPIGDPARACSFDALWQ